MAATRVAVVAKEPFDYEGHAVTAGEVCLVRPIDALALLYKRRARWPNDLDRAVVTPEPLVAETPAPRRRYRRRDLKAER